MGALSLYLRYVTASMRAQMQYPASFAMVSAAQFSGTVIEVVGVWALFQRFHHIAGWSFGEVAIFYGVINVTFACADAVTRGFDVFGPEFVKTGNFDRLLLRPRTAAFQLISYELRLSRIGRLLQGAGVFLIGARIIHFQPTPEAVALLAWAVLGGMALFTGILVLQATLSFWTVESLEVANILSYGGVQAGQYPISVYANWFRELLTYVVPIACVSYLPVLGALGRHDPLGAPDWLIPFAPMAGFIFLGASLWVWGFGVRRYTSTGS
jgi:ABC-2 type transport system permease protein